MANLGPHVKYRMDLCYSGTNYHGWQSQTSGKTIQDTIEFSLSKICNRRTRIIASSRTDTGVHARHQVAIFKSETEIDPYKVKRSLNSLLPADIFVKSLVATTNDFHPIYSSCAKLYSYTLRVDGARDPFTREFQVETYGVDPIILQSCLQMFVGTFDFTSFCAVDSSAKTKVREVLRIWTEPGDGVLVVWFLGRGFLKQMIRNIMGTAMMVARGKMSIEDCHRALLAKDRQEAGPCAPAHGLVLEKVFFDEVEVRLMVPSYKPSSNFFL